MSEKKRYSVLVNGEGEVNDRVAGTREFVENMLLYIGAPYRYSKSKDDFVLIKNMHDEHLINAIKEEFEFVSSFDDVEKFLNGPLMEEYRLRTVHA